MQRLLVLPCVIGAKNYLGDLFRGLRLVSVDVRAIGGPHLIISLIIRVAGRPSVGVAAVKIGEFLMQNAVD